MTRCRCTHFAGSHAHNGEGVGCMVMHVSGPPVNNNAAYAEVHMGRTVTQCPCTAFDPEPLQDKEI